MLDNYFDFDLDWNKYKPHFFKLTKHISKVKSIYLEKSVISSKNLTEWLDMWLRCSSRIKRVDINDGIDEDDEPEFKDLVKVLLKGNLKSLNIYGEQPKLITKSQHQFSKIRCFTYTSKNYVEELSHSCRPDINKKIWFRCRYEGDLHDELEPNSPKTRSIDLALYWEYRHQEPEVSYALLEDIVKSWITNDMGLPGSHPRSSISDLKNLKALQLGSPIDMELFIRLLESFPDLSNLGSLKIYNNSLLKYQLFEFCHQLLTIARNLTTLNLSFAKPETPIKCLANFPNGLDLRKLNLSLHITTENDIDNIIGLTRTLKHTQSLSLGIPNSEISLFHPKVYILIEEILKLKLLTKIEIVFKNTKPSIQEEEKDNSFDLSSSLERFLIKQPQVETLKAHVELRSPSERYAFLTNAIQRGGRLKELDINIGEYKLDETAFYHILLMLKNLKSIEILKLEGFSITKEAELSVFIKEIGCLQRLRVLKLGKVMKMPSQYIAVMVKFLLSNPDMRKVIFSVSSEILEVITKIKSYTAALRNIKIESSNRQNSSIALFSKTNDSLQWEKRYYDIYLDRKHSKEGSATVGGMFRHIERGRPKISWFEEH